MLNNDFQMIILGHDLSGVVTIVKFLKVRFSNMDFRANLVDFI